MEYSCRIPKFVLMKYFWHEPREYIQREVKPKKKEELVDGIMQFRETVHVNKT